MKLLSRYQQLPRALRLLVEVALFIGLWFGIQAWQTRTMPRGPLPAVSGVDIRNASHLALPADGDGPYMVHFWASWCPICKLMESSVTDVAADYPVIGIALQSGSDSEVLDFMREHGMDYPMLNDPDGQISRRFGVNGVPSTFIVDKNNTIRFVERGYSSAWGLKARLWYAK
ncbi:MAG: protein disulfide oxidoreductase [Gammaproteobacteria bacterium]|nr:protein disulfide oxidoreductase [Gammaproteobacteria bacterium]